MAKTKKEQLLLKLTKLDFGNIIFSLGIIIILVAGFLNFEKEIQQIVIGTLIILGIAIGINNITKKETIPFLVSTGIIILTMAPLVTIAIQPQNGQVYSVSVFTYLAQALIQNATVYTIVMNITNFFTALIVPAAIMAAIKTIYETARD